SRPPRDGNDEGSSAERPDAAVFQNGKNALGVVTAPERVAGVGETVFVKRPGEQERRAHHEQGCGQRPERQEKTIEAPQRGAENEADEGSVRGGPCPVFATVRKASDGSARHENEGRANPADNGRSAP